jgi:hypothetical protein
VREWIIRAEFRQSPGQIKRLCVGDDSREFYLSGTGLVYSCGSLSAAHLCGLLGEPSMCRLTNKERYTVALKVICRIKEPDYIPNRQQFFRSKNISPDQHLAQQQQRLRPSWYDMISNWDFWTGVWRRRRALTD